LGLIFIDEKFKKDSLDVVRLWCIKYYVILYIEIVPFHSAHSRLSQPYWKIIKPLHESEIIVDFAMIDLLIYCNHYLNIIKLLLYNSFYLVTICHY
jgi:hypothetical protein